MKAWHFLKSNKKLGYKDGREVKIGEKLTICGPLELCKKGLHASVKPLDALNYLSWNDSIICLVELSGEITEGGDKCVASERTVLKWCKADEILHRFAIRVAGDVLPIYEKKYPGDDRLRKAIETKKLWLEGKVTDEELRAAADAAAGAARAAYAVACDACAACAADAAACADAAADAAARAACAVACAADADARAADAACAADAAADAAACAADAARAADAIALAACADACAAYAAARAACAAAARDKYNKWLEEMFLEEISNALL